MTRVLYVGSHAVLEYDDLRLLDASAASVFSIGLYTNPRNPAADIRPALELAHYDWDALQHWWTAGLTPGSWMHDRAFLKRFDVVVLVMNASMVAEVIEDFPIPIFLRTIGQNDPAQEAWIAHLAAKSGGRMRFVRYSPNERHLEHFAGEDAMIRFGKTADDFLPRGDGDGRVVSFCTATLTRPGPCNYRFYEQATAPFERALFGAGNADLPWCHGAVPYSRQCEILSRASVYFCLGTLPASYTLNLMEAMFAGAAVVTIGSQAFERSPEAEERLRLPGIYEAPDFLAGAPIRLAVDSVEQAHATIAALLADSALAEQAGAFCRARAESLFAFDRIVPQWKALFAAV